MFNNKPSYTLPLPDQETPTIEQFFEASNPTTTPSQWGSVIEGQLTVDVLETENSLVIVATMAGTKPEDIQLHLHNDFLTIRGKRMSPETGGTHYFYQECYWGAFSRTIVLPVDVKGELAQSEYKNGVLTIRIPKAETRTSIPILLVEE